MLLVFINKKKRVDSTVEEIIKNIYLFLSEGGGREMEGRGQQTQYVYQQDRSRGCWPCKREWLAVSQAAVCSELSQLLPTFLQITSTTTSTANPPQTSMRQWGRTDTQDRVC